MVSLPARRAMDEAVDALLGLMAMPSAAEAVRNRPRQQQWIPEDDAIREHIEKKRTGTRAEKKKIRREGYVPLSEEAEVTAT